MINSTAPALPANVKGWTEAASGGRWRPRFRIGGREGRKHSGPYFDYRWEAEAWIETELPRRLAGVAPAPAPSSSEAALRPVSGPSAAFAAMTLSAYAAEYLDRRRGLVVASTLDGYARAVERFGTLGEVPMGDVLKRDVERWLTGLVGERVGRPSINAALKLLRMLYRDAGLGDPSLGIRRLSTLIAAEVILDRTAEAALLAAAVDEASARKVSSTSARDGIRHLAEVAGVSTGSCSRVLNGKGGASEALTRRVLDAVEVTGYVHRPTTGPDLELRAMILLGLDCGLRWEEIAGLPADAIAGDFLRVRQAIERASKAIVPPKGRRARNVPLTPRVRAALAPLVLAARRRGPEALVFLSQHGTPLDYWRSSDRFNAATSRAGLDPAPSWHDLRHTYATRLAAAGVPTSEIAALLGHADEKITQRYVHAGTDGRRLELVLAALGSVEAAA